MFIANLVEIDQVVLPSALSTDILYRNFFGDKWTPKQIFATTVNDLEIHLLTMTTLFVYIVNKQLKL